MVHHSVDLVLVNMKVLFYNTENTELTTGFTINELTKYMA